MSALDPFWQAVLYGSLAVAGFCMIVVIAAAIVEAHAAKSYENDTLHQGVLIGIVDDERKG